MMRTSILFQHSMYGKSLIQTHFTEKKIHQSEETCIFTSSMFYASKLCKLFYKNLRF